MLLPPVIRIFFAIDLPDSMKACLAEYIGELKRATKSKSIRWSRPDNLHITLQFMPEVRTEHLAGMVHCVKEELQTIKDQMAIRLGGIHFFPSMYRPRVIVLDVLPQAPLINLSALVGRGITAMQYDIESRPFRAHLTLGRIKHQDVRLDLLSSLKPPKMDELMIKEVVLFRSEPQSEGSQYTVLERISL